MALCLMKQKKFQRANTMIDQVLAIDPTNFKAWVRKANNHLEFGEHDKTRKALMEAEKHVISMEERTEVTNLYKVMAQKTMEDAKFSQKIFGNKDQLYKDKPDLTKIKEYTTELENEHLATLSNI